MTGYSPCMPGERPHPGFRYLSGVSCQLERNHMDLGEIGQAHFGCRQDRGPGIFWMCPQCLTLAWPVVCAQGTSVE